MYHKIRRNQRILISIFVTVNFIRLPSPKHEEWNVQSYTLLCLVKKLI